MSVRQYWVARIAVVLLLGMSSLPLMAVTHLVGDDPDCDSSLAPRHVSSQLEAPKQAPVTQHCTVCHWIHVVTDRGPGLVRGPYLQLQPESFVAMAHYAWAGQVDAAGLASRAPPARSL